MSKTMWKDLAAAWVKAEPGARTVPAAERSAREASDSRSAERASQSPARSAPARAGKEGTVQNGSVLYVYQAGETKRRKFVIDTYQRPEQAAFLGHEPGDTVELQGTSYRIDEICR